MSRLSDAVRALRHRNFRLFFTGQIISLVGTWMQTIAESWLVYRLTGSAAKLGMVGFCSQIPVFLIAPIGGAAADQSNRRRTLVFTQSAAMVLALVYAILTLTGRIRIWEIFVLAALLGVVNGFDIPTRQAFVVDMVGKEDLMNAIALNSSMFNGARIIGPAVAGILVASVGEGWCFFINSVSYVAVIAGLLMMVVPHRRVETGNVPPLRRIAEGFRFTATTGPIAGLLLLLGLVSLAGMPFAVLMPIFADRVLHGGARTLGLLMSASGAGALAGAFTLALRKGIKGLGAWVATAAAGFGAALVAFSLSHTVWVSAILLVPVGYALMVEMASSNTLIQAMVPDALRGRVMAVYSMMFMGMAPIGALLAGLAAHVFGAAETVAAGGVLCIAGAAAFAWKLPSLRTEGRRLILAQQAVAGEPAAGVIGTNVRE
ncbi:MAG TPA: MFS transporter [Thermoanaerobaculia bacterium]|nr:MFS transporter [Thermoanaerobaculia bacterium]